MTEQPPPIPNDQPSVWQLVLRDMYEREQIGIMRYGTPLQVFNGRDSLQDAYEESLDKTVYLKQAILERERIFRAIREGDMDFLRSLVHATSQI